MEAVSMGAPGEDERCSFVVMRCHAPGGRPALAMLMSENLIFLL